MITPPQWITFIIVSSVLLNSKPSPPNIQPDLITTLSPIIVFSLITTNSSIFTFLPITTFFSLITAELLIEHSSPIIVSNDFLI